MRNEIRGLPGDACGVREADPSAGADPGRDRAYRDGQPEGLRSVSDQELPGDSLSVALQMQGDCASR